MDWLKWVLFVTLNQPNLLWKLFYENIIMVESFSPKYIRSSSTVSTVRWSFVSFNAHASMLPWEMNQRWNDIWIFQTSFRNCKNCVHNCEDHSLIHLISYPQFIHDTFHISFHHWFIPHGSIGTHKWPAPNVSGFIAQLVRASHQYREVTGSNPVEVLNLSGFVSYAIAKLRS